MNYTRANLSETAYTHWLKSDSKQHHKRNNSEQPSKQKGVPNAHKTVAPTQTCPQERQGGGAAHGSDSTDDSKRKSTEESIENQKEVDVATSTKQRDAPIQSEHPEKRAKIDVEMQRECPAFIGVISLFGGVSSVLPAITEILGGQPTIFVGAECDQTLGHLVAEKHGFRLDGQWRKHPSGMSSIYIDDVKKLFRGGM